MKVKPEIGKAVNGLAQEAGIKKSTWEKFKKILSEVRRHHRGTYYHCLRVGYYSYGLAKKEKWRDTKLPLFGGCGHDYGKFSVSSHLLSNKRITEKEFEKIKKHTTQGFDKLKHTFLFTSFIAGLHHKYKDGGYGIDLDKVAPPFFKKSDKNKIKRTAELVMLCDFFDALITRRNNKGLLNDISNEKEIKKVMRKFFPSSSGRINWLLKNKV